MNTEQIKAMQDLLNSGYAGVDSTGKIVDRREFPMAVPIQKNTMLGVPAPQRLQSDVRCRLHGGTGHPRDCRVCPKRRK